MNSFKSTTFGLVLAALVVLLCIQWTEAQKTRANSFQQEVGIGNNQNAAYGGYQGSSSFEQQRQTSLVAPVNQQRRTQQTYKSRQQSQPARQPVYQPQPQPQQQQQQYDASSSSSSSSYDQQAEADAEPASYGSVAGKPGQDFPGYTQVPKTSFSCDGLPYDYGMYADEETGCQAYHVCYNGRKDSFLCGVGTVFNQRILHCDYWYSVDCGKSSQYYSSNAYMGSSQPEPGPAQASGSSQPQPQQQQSSYQSSGSSRTQTYNRPAQPQRAQQQSSYSRNTQPTQQQQVQEEY